MDDPATITETVPTDGPDATGPAAAGGSAAASTPPGAAVPLRVSDTALGQVLAILAAEEHPETLALRVEVTGVNGVEYSYDLSFEEQDTAEPDDLIYSQGELVVMIPAESVDPLWGATLDLPSAAGRGGLVIRNPNRPDPLTGYDVELSGTVSERINQLLDQSINPALASHGGFAKLVDVIDAKAVVTMGGGCQGCAVSALTLREGIQKSILEHVPEITEVVDATDHDAGENPFYTE
ncbi:MAG: nitrogen-fixing NifU domain protein [Acidimicrobiales bacterium]|nr:nitrogen-fixing NifU domain protein [Acidimicrobiales bacterium]